MGLTPTGRQVDCYRAQCENELLTMIFYSDFVSINVCANLYVYIYIYKAQNETAKGNFKNTLIQ